MRRVDPGLASDRGVHRRQQRGGDGDEWHAPEVGRGHETGQVGDDAAAEPDDQGVAAETAREQFVFETLLLGPGLGVLSRRHRERDRFFRQYGVQVDAVAPQRLLVADRRDPVVRVALA